MNHQYHASYENIMLRPLERKDIENLRVWRNDATQTRFLRKIDHITPEMQEKWYESYLKDNDTIAFAIEETEHLHRMVGSLSLYDFHILAPREIASFARITPLVSTSRVSLS